MGVAAHLARVRRARMLRALRLCRAAAARRQRMRALPRRCAESAACRRGLSALVGSASRRG